MVQFYKERVHVIKKLSKVTSRIEVDKNRIKEGFGKRNLMS